MAAKSTQSELPYEARIELAINAYNKQQIRSISAAANAFNVDRGTLYYRIKKLGKQRVGIPHLFPILLFFPVQAAQSRTLKAMHAKRDNGVTDIESVSTDGRSLSPLIIRLVAGY